MLLIILVAVLLLAALGALPSWPYSRSWGYYPSGGLGLVVLPGDLAIAGKNLMEPCGGRTTTPTRAPRIRRGYRSR